MKPKFKMGDKVIVIKRHKDCNSCNECFVGCEGTVKDPNYCGKNKVWVYPFKKRVGGCSGFNNEDLKVIKIKRSGKVSLVIC